VKVLGSLALIDEGETDHKIIILRDSDPHFDEINSINDLELYKPRVISRLLDWLKNYKTSDGKPVNKLKSDSPTTASEAVAIIQQVNLFYKNLVSKDYSTDLGYYLPGK
jgi:3'-phosphoadenosine 5'-phosphosulfate synthase